jgi:hypothetical protein
MPRPTLEKELRKTVREYLAIAENLSVEEAPLNTLAVALRLGYDRKTLKKYGFDAEISEVAERQAQKGKPSPKELKRRSDSDLLRQRDEEITAMRQRCEELIARVCLAEGNAQRLGIDPIELWQPLPVPDRSVSRAGQTRRLRERY